MSREDIPDSVHEELDSIEQAFSQAHSSEFAQEKVEVDPLTQEILSNLENIGSVERDEPEEKPEARATPFDVKAFQEILPFILNDQISAIKKEKISIEEFSLRFDRWFLFCDGIIRHGVTCIYNADLIREGDYQKVFETLSVNAAFTKTFLAPHGLKVELVHRSEKIKEKAPWLAMPALAVPNEDGTVTNVAIAGDPRLSRWYETLLEFYAGFDSRKAMDAEQEAFDESPHPTLDD